MGAYPPEFRLKNRREFDAVFKGASHKQGNREFLMLAIPNGHVHSRIGMVVSKRTAGNAVCRNRIKRQVREIFRLGSIQHRGLDIVVVTRPGVVGVDKSRLANCLQGLFGRLQGAASPDGQQTVVSPRA